MYEVWTECDGNCESYEDQRLSLTTDDPVKAIKHSIMLRDRTHYTEIRIQPTNI